ncbi:MXAN_5187 family protein [Pyxidicoccus xibeiensis]|uniref:MXAN_5187 family protein n=1 Tax=Pyxidicoccus xibeiensis TaxID=2906759 RepID=UPI0020A7CBF7|nr:MXAN_5187 family protein [Pyxidicoccus xibeiensis]MCP3140582.1 cell division protein FtsK [Pyxidicoccus xibeiensis]
MVRLKFLVFAFLVIGLGLAHLPMLSGPLRERAVAGAATQAGAGAAEVARRVDARRAQVQSLTLKLAATPEVVSAVAALQPARSAAPRNPRERDEDDSGPQPLTPERFAAVRTAVEAALPKELQGAVVALVAQDVQFHAVAGGEPSQDTAKLDVAAVAKAGTTVVEALGAPHAFAAVPLLSNGGSRGQPLATLVLGAPLVDASVLEAAVQASGASALALVKGDAVVAAAGPEKVLAEGSLAQVQLNGSPVVLRSGHLQALGPVLLPVFTNGDFMGGKAPLMVGSRRALEGTPLEVLAVADTGAVLGALAAYQQTAVMGLGGLLGLTLLWTLLMGSGRRGDEVQGNSDTLSLSAAMAAAAPPAPQHASAPQPAAPLGDAFAMPPPAHAPAADPFALSASTPAPMADPFAMSAPTPGPMADPFAMSPPAQSPMGDPFALPPPAPAPAASPFSAADPFGSADAFPFPAPPPTPAPYTPPPPAPAPFSAAAMPFEPDPASFGGEPLAPASPRRGAFAFEDQPTAAYSLQQAADPFSLAAAQAVPENPETTRVAAIPRELLQASARPAEVAIPMPPPRSVAPPPAAIPLPGLGNSAVALSEEQHFQEVFREFVTTRERCGEAADGLTYDKFVQKLRKNKEQLVQKYACKTVRFQVYVKEGKAALKATPVKD